MYKLLFWRGNNFILICKHFPPLCLLPLCNRFRAIMLTHHQSHIKAFGNEANEENIDGFPNIIFYWVKRLLPDLLLKRCIIINHWLQVGQCAGALFRRFWSNRFFLEVFWKLVKGELGEQLMSHAEEFNIVLMQGWSYATVPPNGGGKHSLVPNLIFLIFTV